MELYTKVAYENSKHITLRYSTSFGVSTKLFSKNVRDHIYAIYALARIGDEIVDTYKGENARQLLDQLEDEVYASLQSGYSTNPVVHAFIDTARTYAIPKTLIKPFFASMRMDLTPREYDPEQYDTYIHGSAEVIGLMCLKVFVAGDEALYNDLLPGAKALGAAYQKINFLRDLAADYKHLGRLYFPAVSFDTFNEHDKELIIQDIRNDLSMALPAMRRLPASSLRATLLSYIYYEELLQKLEKASVETIKQERIRIPGSRKFWLLMRTLILGKNAL